MKKRKRLSRRDFIKLSSSLTVGVALSTIPSWLRAAALGASNDKTLVVLFLRGAADGLNIVVPFKDPNYHKSRPTLGLAEPSQGRGVLDLDGTFGFHPALSPLMPLWKEGKLAIVHAAGSTEHVTRSHFDAQDDMETGTPGLKATSDGWLNRALQVSADYLKEGPLTAVALSPRLPRILRGDFQVSSMPNARDYKFKQGDSAADAFEQMYADGLDSLLGRVGKQSVESVRQIQSLLSKPDNSGTKVEYGQGALNRGLSDLARLIKSGAGMKVAFVDVGGWDHHTNEEYRLTELMREVGSALSSFFKDLGDKGRDVTLVTMTEFGRTVRENGARGTDHGWGSVMFVAGGPVKGGKVFGKWPGLAEENLFEGRDLKVTTDYRQVYCELLTRHLGVKNLSAVFPGYSAPSGLGLI